MKTQTKINFGCGLNALDGWINIDNSYNAKIAKYPKIKWILYKLGFLSKDMYKIPWDKVQNIKSHDVRKNLPFNDNSVNYIYSSHLIEHLEKKEAQKFLNECYRILKNGGLLRIITPDLYILTNNYIESFKNFDNNASDNFLETLELLDHHDKTMMEKIFGKGNSHKWLYDKNSLKKLLIVSGFSQIEEKSYKTGKMPDINLLDNRPKISLYMEAKKISDK